MLRSVAGGAALALAMLTQVAAASMMFRGAMASISGFGGQGGCECCECGE